MNSVRRGHFDARVATIVLGLLLAAVLFVGSTFAAAPTNNQGSRISQASNRQAPNAPQDVVVVSPSNMDGWQTTNGTCDNSTPTGSVGFVPGPGTPPLGVGSFQLAVGGNGNSFPNIRNRNYEGIRLDQLTALSYSTYVSQPVTNTGQAPYIILNLDYTGDLLVDDQLFFEPVYQNGTYGGQPVPNQCGAFSGCVVTNTWQTWNALIGGWWSADDQTGGPPLHTLASYSAAHPGARIINNPPNISGILGGVRIVAGCGHPTWSNFVGNVDNVTIAYGPIPTATSTATRTATSTATATPTLTEEVKEATATPTGTATGTATATEVPSSTSTETATQTATEVPSSTATETAIVVPSATSTATATETALLVPHSPSGAQPATSNITYDFEPDQPTATITSTSTSTTVPSSTSTTVPSSTSTTVPSSTTTTMPSSTTAATGTSTRTATSVASTSTVVPSATACPIQFADVPPDHTFYTFVRCLACRAIVGGYPCGGPGEQCNANDDPYYRPGANVTRGQLSKIIANSAGLDDPIAEGQQQFADVPPGSPFYEFVERLAQTGAIAGYPCGGPGVTEPCDSEGRPYFRPNNPATRGQISKIVSIAAGFEEDVPSDQQTFTDVDQDSPFWVYIERLAGRGIISGYGEASRCPETGAPCFRYNENTTRGQMAKIAANAFFPNCSTPARP
ncbi:MAG TPA: S-layer homology domain-containing protein [Chloroflexia bacterium]